MPKIKTSRAAAKRFKKTGAGKLKRNKVPEYPHGRYGLACEADWQKA